MILQLGFLFFHKNILCFFFLVLAGSAGIITAFPIAQIYSDSMAPTLQEGEFVMINRLAYLLKNPQYNDIIVYRNQNGPVTRKVVKRCLLPPGEPLQWRGDLLYIKGEFYTLDRSVRRVLKNYTRIPDNTVFAIGENLDSSIDSRNYGLVPTSRIIGSILFFSKAETH